MESLIPSITHHAAPLNLQFSMHHAAHTPAAFFHFAPALITPLMSTSLPVSLSNNIMSAEVTYPGETKYVTGPGYDLLTERKILLVLFQTRMYSLLV